IVKLTSTDNVSVSTFQINPRTLTVFSQVVLLEVGARADSTLFELERHFVRSILASPRICFRTRDLEITSSELSALASKSSTYSCRLRMDTSTGCLSAYFSTW